MNIISVFTLLGGLGIFLFGMNFMGECLEKSAGKKLKTMLDHLTSNTAKGILLGVVVTAIIQSSTATTVMVVGFVNSGLMEFSQSMGIIVGSNIGTTMTAWLLSLSGAEGGNIFVQLFKPTTLSLICAVAGIILYMFVKRPKSKDIGGILLGFAVLLVGMGMMSDAVKPLADNEEFKNLLSLFSNPILGVIAGTVFTAIIQSSSAAVGIVQALCVTGQITCLSALPIILGANIGACATAILSSIGANKNAKRAALFRLYFNTIGVALFMILFYFYKWIANPDFLYAPMNAANVAIVHSFFNIFTTLALLPFMKQFEKLAYILIKDNKKEKDAFIDERLLQTPAVAISQCKHLTDEMAILAKDNFISALKLLENYDKKIAAQIEENEARTDVYEDKLGTFLVKVCRKNLSVSDSHETSNLLHTIGDFERISDHALNMAEVAKEIFEKELTFSDEAVSEINNLKKALSEILDITIDAFIKNDIEEAKKVEPLEQVIDLMKNNIKSSHVMRLQEGKCTIETGFVLSDLVTNCERVADHCSNIAVCLIQVDADTFNTHKYLNKIKTHGDAMFDEMYNEYLDKYGLA